MTYEEMINEYFTRTVSTGFSDANKGIKILSNVFGQMSDGIWEESNAITGYWQCARVNGEDGNLLIATTYRSPSSYYKCKNPFRKMSDDAIRTYFANKIKQVVRINLEDNYEAGVRRYILAKRELEDKMIVPTAKYNEHKTAAKEIEQYLEENPFNFRGKFNSNNETVLDYLSDYNGTKITVSEAYKAYKDLIVAQGEEKC